jgi:hypothetical protein
MDQCGVGGFEGSSGPALGIIHEGFAAAAEPPAEGGGGARGGRRF